MTVEQCCMQICRAICRNWNEVVIDQKWWMHIVLRLFPLWAWLEDVAGAANFRDQMKAIEDAE
jgi:hypothetical protein